jgi:hypothetical protein
MTAATAAAMEAAMNAYRRLTVEYARLRNMGARDGGVSLQQLLAVMPTFAVPNRGARLTSKAARAAYRGYISLLWAADQGHRAPGYRDWELVAYCDCCSKQTGNFCDECVGAGRSFVTLFGDALAGRPRSAR